ncbi:MAG: hypothetical protein P8N49_05680 [Opitutales bacterium]|nr:hypothetical protein [Opitutales bacterium]
MLSYTSQSKALQLLCIGIIIFTFGSCSEKKLSSDDVEYRKDEKGNEILFAIGEEKPFGTGKRAYVTDKHENGQIRFEIGFVNGLKDGKMEFWQSNGLPELTGIYSRGMRDGTFTAYGKTGELVYRKNFKEDKLDGNFTLYYPSSISDISRFYDKLSEVRSSKPFFSSERLSKIFSSKKVNPREIKVKNHLRLESTFKEDYPIGQYRAYFHPGKQNLSLDELLKEEGFFSDSNQSRGQLQHRQKFYYPRATGLVVVLPGKKRLDGIHPTTRDGFSRAIDEAKKTILEIPSYRNPDKEPALVFTVDNRGNEIVPIWSSHIQSFAVRNLDGFLLPKSFPKTTYETYLDEIVPFAQEWMVQLDLSEDPKIPVFINQGASVDIVGLNDKGEIIDIFWSSPLKTTTDTLENRIFAKRMKISRDWDQGNSSEADWLLHNGSKLFLRGKSNLANWKASP